MQPLASPDVKNTHHSEQPAQAAVDVPEADAVPLREYVWEVLPPKAALGGAVQRGKQRPCFDVNDDGTYSVTAHDHSAGAREILDLRRGKLLLEGVRKKWIEDVQSSAGQSALFIKSTGAQTRHGGRTQLVRAHANTAS